MNIFFWILVNLAVLGILAVVIWQIVNQELQTQWAGQMQKLKTAHQLFEEQKQFWERSYSNNYSQLREKEKVVQEKEKELQALKGQLDIQIAKNNQDTEKFIEAGRAQLKGYELYIKKLESQLESARQRSKRFAKQAKNQV
ncbi:MAG: hypothetical protein Q8935_09155 [Bacillota bacterium]|nr:hypothetical protein [Bacillota bacterium]